MRVEVIESGLDPYLPIRILSLRNFAKSRLSPRMVTRVYAAARAF